MTDRGRAGDDDRDDAADPADDHGPSDDAGRTGGDRTGDPAEDDPFEWNDDPAGADDAADPPADDPASASADGTATVESEPETENADRDVGVEVGSESGGPPPRGDDPVPDPHEHPIGWYLNSTNTLVLVSRDVLSSLAVVVVIGLVLFAISGVWPPLVAIESGSMEPNMQQGDLVFLVDSERFAPEEATEHGIVTREVGERTGHESFGQPGSVIVYRPNGGDATPIIHRAEFHVQEDENWVDRANPRYLGGYDSCDQMPASACPAPHDGYVTKGDANGGYDQARMQSAVVRPEWVEGRAVFRVPYLGCIRLALTDAPNCW